MAGGAYVIFFSHKVVSAEGNKAFGRTFLAEGEYVVSGAHKPERATSMRSSDGVFTDQFTFRTVFAGILNILNSTNQSAKPTDLNMIFFAF